MNAPKVSVVMLVYNGERFVRDAIESVLVQTYTDFELLIVDDGSTDGTPAILNEYALSDARIRIHTQPRNLGIAVGRNTGLQLARGEYLAVMDADDVSLPERLAKQVAYLDAHPEVGVLGAEAWLIDEAGQRQGALAYPTSHNLICWALCFYDPLINPSVMLRTEVARSVGGYREEFPPTEDYDLWARLSGQTKLSNLPEKLLLLRKHSSNATVTQRQHNLQQSAKVSLGMFERLLTIELPITPIELAWEPRKIPAPDLNRLARAILSLRDHFFQRVNLSAEERAFIRRETALQLFRLIRNADSPVLASTIFARACAVDPFALPQALRLALRRTTS